MKTTLWLIIFAILIFSYFFTPLILLYFKNFNFLIGWFLSQFITLGIIFIRLLIGRDER